MKKVSLLFLCVFVLGQSFVFAGIQAPYSPQEKSCISKWGRYDHGTKKCEININTKYDIFKSSIESYRAGLLNNNFIKSCENGQGRLKLIGSRSYGCLTKNQGLLTEISQQLTENDKIILENYAQGRCIEIGGEYIPGIECSFTKNSNKTIIISTLIFLVGFGIIATVFLLRKLNQKNKSSLPPQQ